VSALLLGLLLTGCAPAVRHIVPPPVSTPSARPQVAPAEARRLYLLGQLALLHGDNAQAAVYFAGARRFDPTSPWIPVAQGDVALAQGQIPEARAAWTEATRLDPACHGAWMRLARVQRVGGDLEQSVDSYRQAVATGEGWHARAELVELLDLLDRGEEARQAVTDWAQAAEATPREALRARAEARWATGDLEGAFQDLDAYIEDRPEDLPALDSYLLLAMQLGHRGRALQRLDAVRVALPADEGVLRRQVAYLDEIGHLPRLLRALDALREALAAQDPGALASEDPGLLADRARALLGMHRAAEAQATLDQLARLSPDWPRLALLRAQAWLDQGKPTRARAALDAVPPDPGETVPRAELLRLAGALAEAQALVDAARTQRPDSPPLIEEAARLAAARGEDEEGLRLAARLGPEPETRYLRLLTEVGRASVAQARLERRIGAAPSAADLRALGALRLEKDPAGAVPLLKRATGLAPHDGRARYLLAAALFQAGQHGRAQLEARSALLEDPRDAAALNLLAWALTETGGDATEAVGLARRAVDLDPADAHLVDTLGWALARAGQLPEAVLTLSEAASLDPANAEIQAHLDAARRGVLPRPPWQPR